MNKYIKMISCGSAAGIVGILAKPAIVGATSSIIGSITTLTKGCFAIGATLGVPISGGAVLSLVVLYAVCTCVDLDSINYAKLLGWEDKENVEDKEIQKMLEEAKEDLLVEKIVNRLDQKITKEKAL